MKSSLKPQSEWLLEDMDQIRRFFPGATIIEVLDTPFDIHPPLGANISKKSQPADQVAHSLTSSNLTNGEVVWTMC